MSTMANCFKGGFDPNRDDSQGMERLSVDKFRPVKSRGMLAIEDGPAVDSEQAPAPEQPDALQLVPSEAPPADEVAESVQELQQALKRDRVMKRPAAAAPTEKAAGRKPKAKAAAKSKAKPAPAKAEAGAAGNRKEIRK